MRLLLIVAFAAVAYASHLSLPHSKVAPVESIFAPDAEIEIISDSEEIAPAFIVSWQARRAIKKMQKGMPCGWPDYGIPPLAPLKLYEGEVELKKGLLSTFDKVFKFRVDGLDNFEIKKFKLNMILSKVTFDFRFKNIQTTAQSWETDTLFDALRELGLSVEYEGKGDLDFNLYNLRVAGVLKYKIPILWGSIKITSLKTEISVESCSSEIGGLVGDGAANRMINRQIENFLVNGINNNQQEISDYIEDNFVPKVNQQLKGNDFWTLIDLIFSSDEKEDDPIVTKCVPPQDPWGGR